MALAVVAAFVMAGLFFGARPFCIWRARAALEDRDGQRAISWLEAADWLDRDHPQTHFLLARANRRLGRFEDVRSHLERAWRLGYPFEQVQREQWLALAQSGQLAAVEPYFDQLLMDPQDDGPEICEAMVSGYMLHYRFGEALAILDAWEGDYPEDYLPHLARGLLLDHLGDATGAAEAFRRALHRSPNRTEIRLRLARALMQVHEYDEAVEHFRSCADEQPDNVLALTGWAQCLKATGAHADARTLFERVLSLEPDNVDCLVAMGELELMDRRPEEALRWLSRALEVQPSSVNVRYPLAQAYQHLGLHDEAREHFEFVAEARAVLARVREHMETVLGDPRNVQVRYEIGVGLLDYEARHQGAAWLRSVLDIDPHHQPTHRALAEYYSEVGNQELAARHRALGGAFEPDEESEEVEEPSSSAREGNSSERTAR